MARIESRSEVEALFPRRRSEEAEVAGAAEAGAATLDEQHRILPSLRILPDLNEAGRNEEEWNISSLRDPEVALHNRAASISSTFPALTANSGRRNNHLIPTTDFFLYIPPSYSTAQTFPARPGPVSMINCVTGRYFKYLFF